MCACEAWTSWYIHKRSVKVKVGISRQAASPHPTPHRQKTSSWARMPGKPLQQKNTGPVKLLTVKPPVLKAY